MKLTGLRLLFLGLLVAGTPFALALEPSRAGLVRPADGLLALVGARVVDGTGAPAREGCTVLIEDDRIRAVGPDVEVPEGAEVVDLEGLTVVPGLIDVHGHMYATLGGRPASQLRAYGRLYLAGGTTTVFSPGEYEPEGTFVFRDAQREGEEISTRIYTAGPYFNHGGGARDWMGGIDGPEEARELFRKWEPSMDGVKVYMDITPEELAAVVEEADRAGLKVTGHLGSITAGDAIDLGIDRLEHGIFAMSEFGRPDPSNPFAPDFLRTMADIDFESGVGAKLIDKIVERGVVIDPTIVILEVLFTGGASTPDWKRYLEPSVAQYMGQVEAVMGGMRKAATQDPAEFEELVQAFLEKQRELVRRVHERGGTVLAGTDPVLVQAVPGYALPREAEHLVLAGMSELEALRACTLAAASELGLDDELGSIEPGKLADLLVVEGDPTADIRALANARQVYQAGARYSPTELRESVVGTIR